MKVLSIDTSNYTLGIALIDGDQVIGEYITNIKKNHSVRVMPAIETLMSDCDITPADLSKIVVAKGPGSYTGVRIGVTIAKTLAWTLNIPLAGVSSLEVSAATAGRYFEGVISPLFDARRGQIYTGLYQFRQGKIYTIKKDLLLLSKDWAAELKGQREKVLFIGNDLPLHQSILKEILGDQAVFAEITEQNPRPAELALLGREKEAEEIHSFVPNYIRLAEAEANWIKANKESK
ncbi:tRNA (adenosine(37)-N6)-threonylcarbamoyltransferase complex dimerization subunit type 1 TsaB [Bacillus sp. FJAT-29790]|uniref:tRNA (adenosine(37)-N6)-threonylcarbamoyltransferase complex dimerization subunit type 1 TsaB n=1 Tax=Bacillus sp. FJAT-29790 TaxID=1895002 RepID=UPI001C248644|nr:tRNA (adenosine(37)-N6)-threonylcarbamoyltransferase complex dimerization subunit type 1 TsaB [Bacillus sp. FJAT-29790]MBU8881295.1 tRNA (adenosine(37)-N6)-threonylcarbamoyltransferase complex dimerization subunit type 1 TsaB [Bacillus sp. FJAT-29790]